VSTCQADEVCGQTDSGIRRIEDFFTCTEYFRDCWNSNCYKDLGNRWWITRSQPNPTFKHLRASFKTLPIPLFLENLTGMRISGSAQVLGAVKRSTTGFSTASYSVDRLHTGFIYHCPLVQSTRPEDRMKAQRKVGAKVALAARVDVAGSSPGGMFGEECRKKLVGEMERLARPPPKKVTKALPRPDEKKKNRRGGKR